MTSTPVERKKIDELVMLYELEEDICDIYVEGITDKNVLEWYFHNLGLTEINVIEISDIDITNDLLDEGFESNNRDRIITLVYLLNKETCYRSYKGVIDKDLLPYTRNLPTTSNLFTTDYSCLEMYLNNSYILKKVLKLGYNKELPNIDNLMIDVNNALQFIFAVRILDKRHSLNLKKQDLKKCIINNKGRLNFNYEKYLSDTLTMNGLISKKTIYETEIDEIINILKEEHILDTLHGHDFVDFLFTVFIRLKIISNGSKIENFEALLRSALDIEYLKKYNLFINLEQLQTAI